MSARMSTDFIAVHCSATMPSQEIDRDDIARWHTAPPPKGNGWSAIGYHMVIPRDGTIQFGRHPDDVGAHVAGANSRSLGICLVGGINEAGEAEMNYTAEQMDALLVALRLCRKYAPLARIQGHRDFPAVAKDCPSFDVRGWLGTAAPELL